MRSFLEKQMNLNKVYKELFLRDIYKNLFVDEFLYCVESDLATMVRRGTDISPEIFEVDFYRSRFYGRHMDHMRVILYLEQATIHFCDPSLAEKGYYCTIYHYNGDYNDTARSAFIKSNSKTRLALVDKYKYWLKTLDNKKNF